MNSFNCYPHNTPPPKKKPKKTQPTNQTKQNKKRKELLLFKTKTVAQLLHINLKEKMAFQFVKKYILP